MSFEKRKGIGNEASITWVDYCITNGFHYAHTGYENWEKSEGFMESIKNEHVLGVYPYPSWSKIRYIPDWFVIDNGSDGFFADTKNGQGTIEKDAYEFYMELHKKGKDVSLIKMSEGRLKASFIEEVRIKPITTETYKDRFGTDLPVVDKKWIIARLLPQEKYIEWKNKSHGSGTPFGIIDNHHEFEKLMSPSSKERNEVPQSNYMKHKNISDKFIEFCVASKREYAFCGVENWQRSDAFLPALKKSKNQTCKSIKHFPDLMVIKPYNVFKEKHGGSLIKFIGSDLKIEEDAFKLLQDLDCMGLTVMLITVQNNELRYCHIQMANIKDIGIKYEGIPVFETRWAMPKKLKSIEYIEWMKKNNDDSFGFIEEKCFQKLEM